MIGAIVLAAGASRRFGAQKLLAPLRGKPVIQWTVEHVRASSVDDVLIVIGREREKVREALEGLDVRFITNEQYAEGLSASLRAGVQALTADTRAAVIALGDQPTLGPEMIDALVRRYRDTGRGIVVPTYRGMRGNPVLFDASLFGELASVRGDFGAREVIAHEPGRVEEVCFDCPMPEDVDTEEELERLSERWDARNA